MNSERHTKLDFYTLEKSEQSASECSIASLVLCRSEQSNAFSEQMLEEITSHAATVAKRSDCRALVVSGAGRHFSAGADLTWMQKSAKLSYEENIDDAKKLSTMFEAIANLSIPTIAVAKGAVFGGGVGLVAVCAYAIAHTDTKFCLSETRLGLLPAVILPYLARKMQVGPLRRLALTARTFTASEALQYGLIEVIATDDLDETLREDLKHLLACGPEAQKAFLQLLVLLKGNGLAQCDETVHAIATARTSQEGQTGLAGFFAKTPAPWVVKYPDDLSLLKKQPAMRP